MAAPLAGELSIYGASAKRGEVRVAVGVEYPALTAQVQDLFESGTEPDASRWSYSLLGAGVAISSGDMLIRSFGGPLFEFAITKAVWLPDSFTHPFKLTINATFPQADPVYSPVIVIGFLNSELGDLGDIYIWQQGSATSGVGQKDDADDGNIRIQSPGGGDAQNAANDQASHEYVLEWDPNLAVNAAQLRLLVDTVESFTDNGQNSDGEVTPPRYIAFGWIWNTEKNNKTGAVISALAGEQTLIQVHDVTVEQLSAGTGYESISWPAWTSANAGGTDLDTAAEGERFTMDGVVWAKLPAGQIEGVRVERGRSLLHDTFSVTLWAADVDDPDGTPNLFQGDRWLSRPIVVETRVVDGAGNATGWRRQMAGVITEVESAGSASDRRVVLSGRDIVSHELDHFLTRQYRGESTSVEAVNTGFNMRQVWEDLVDVADRLAGVLGETDTDIKGWNLVPADIGTGGQSLLPTFAELCDRQAHEYWRTYATTGTGRYGLLRVNAWTLGGGTPAYTFYGAGAAQPSNVWEVSLAESLLAAPGQVSYRQNRPVVSQSGLYNLFGLPTSGKFPVWPYPSHGRVLHDSIAFAASVQATAVQTLTDKDGNTITGGVAAHRWRAEQTRRRQLRLTAPGHDWPEPTDEIAVDDAGFTGLATSEQWVIDSISLSWERGELTTSLVCMTADWMDAVRRGN